MAQTLCWRQSRFPLGKDGKEKGMVQKAKTKQGDAEVSETVEGSSGVMTKSREGAHSYVPHQPCTADPLPLRAGAEPDTDSSTSRAPRISLQRFTYCHMTF